MTPRLSGHFSTFGLVFSVLKSLLRIARPWSRKKIGNFEPKASESSYGICKVFLVKYTHQYNYIRVAERQIGKSYT